MTFRTEIHDDLALPSNFAAFYARFAPGLLVFFSRRTFDIEIACDLTAETFAEAFRCRHRFRGASDREAAGWLYGIGAHQLNRFIRRGAAETRALRKLGIDVPPLDDEDRVRIAELASLGSLRAAVAEQFSQLPAKQRQALGLRIVDELPYAEVADRLAISEQTARARVSRGLRNLRGAIQRGSPVEVTTP